MSIVLQDPDVTVHQGDALTVLSTLPDASVHMCVTSPPFYGLRDYGTGTWEGGDPDCDHARPPNGGPKSGPLDGSGKRESNGGLYPDICGKCGAQRTDQQIGLEETPEQWADSLVRVFREVRRVLRKDGTLWLEIGDSYSGSGPSGASYQSATTKRRAEGDGQDGAFRVSPKLGARGLTYAEKKPVPYPGLKAKDLVGAPWLLAFALRADGWYLRSEIIWAKPNPMPESVTDRPTTSHSRVFLLTKQPRYFYDADAIREQASENTHSRGNGTTPKGEAKTDGNHADGFYDATKGHVSNRNKRSVWTIATQPLPYDHYAAYPEKLVEPCILAGTSEKGCCPECGAPWVREVEKELVETRGNVGDHGGQGRADPYDAGSSFQWNGGVYGHYETTTTGWAPGCTHNHEPAPCVVLDCFHGSGTTSLVARKHGRHAIGIELNPDYNTIAAQRLQQLSLLA